MATGRKCRQTTVLLITAIVALAPWRVFARLHAADSSVSDSALEKRLVEKTSYTTGRGDTLTRVAYLLYGHKSWWRKLVAINPQLGSYAPEEKLPRNLKIAYLAPRIGQNYVVQPNDWLIRIAQWKYGSSTSWEKIFQANISRIKNPDLIRPGDRLVLNDNGTVINLRTSAVVFEGLQQAKTQAMTQIPRLPQVPASPDSLRQGLETWSGRYHPVYYLAGFCAGVLIFLFAPSSWAYRIQRNEAAAGPKGGLELIAPANRSPRDRAGARLTAQSSYARHEAKAQQSRQKGPESAFKRRPQEDFRFDKSLVVNDFEGVLDRRPNYFSLTGKTSKRYVK